MEIKKLTTTLVMSGIVMWAIPIIADNIFTQLIRYAGYASMFAGVVVIVGGDKLMDMFNGSKNNTEKELKRKFKKGEITLKEFNDQYKEYLEQESERIELEVQKVKMENKLKEEKAKLKPKSNAIEAIVGTSSQKANTFDNIAKDLMGTSSSKEEDQLGNLKDLF